MNMLQDFSTGMFSERNTEKLDRFFAETKIEKEAES